MYLTAYFLAETQIQLGAGTKVQATNFGICLAVGILVGIVVLLYFRKSSKAERFVTDFFATLCLGGGYIAVVQIVFGGKFEPYGLFAYAVGAAVIPCTFFAVTNRRKKKTRI